MEGNFKCFYQKIILVIILFLFGFSCGDGSINQLADQCGDSVCGSEETLFSCPNDCENGITTLVANTEYTVKVGERYQFENRQIDISDIWYDSIIVDVRGSYPIGPRIWLNTPLEVWGITITLVDLHYEANEGNRWAVIIVFM